MADTDLTGMALLRSKRGSLMQAVRALGFSSSAPSKWKQVPAEYVITIEEATGLPRDRLRPDLYAPKKVAKNEASTTQTAAA